MAQKPNLEGYDNYPENIPLVRTAGGTTSIDLNAYAAVVVNDPLFQFLRQANPVEVDRKFKELLKEVNPTVYLLRPTLDDAPSIRYAVMEPRGSIPKLYIRFWYGPYGHVTGYNFDLINPETKEAVCAPEALGVQFFAQGTWDDIMASTTAMQLSAGIDPANLHSIPEKWETTPGNLLRFYDRTSGVVVGEVRAPTAPVGDDPHYECVLELP